MELLLGNCLDRLKELEDNSIDAIVTDPPYGLSFMGKKWDYDVPQVEVWKECLRVLKPGGYLLSFAGTRTQHRMAVNIEDAGFEIRDMIAWVYGSGFPKSLNIGKAVDKINGIIKEELPTEPMQEATEVGSISKNRRCSICKKAISSGNPCQCDRTYKADNEFSGWGTALKPAVESITVALKPFNTVPYYDIIEQEVKELLCQLQQLAKTVVESSKSSQVDTKGESDIAQWSAGEYTSTQEGLSVLMGMLQLESERTLSLNIVLSWLSILGEALKLESKSTIEMKISLITELRTLNSLEWGNISQSIIQAKDSQINIQNADVLTVIGLFIGLELKLKTIQEPFVVESAMLREEEKIFAPNLSPIIMSRKPLGEKTVAENCLKWGVGGINIDGCRVGTEELGGGTMPDLRDVGAMSKESMGIDKLSFGQNPRPANRKEQPVYTGRFPANLIHDGSEEVVGLFPQTKTGSIKPYISKDEGIFGTMRGKEHYNSHQGDSGSAARFFYCAKASKRERNIGCEGLEESIVNDGRETDIDNAFQRGVTLRKNTHPTVKPIALMEYLVKLVSRERQVVLDPFMGSGSTGMACKKLNRDFIGIEMIEEYMEIAKCRIEGVEKESQLNML